MNGLSVVKITNNNMEHFKYFFFDLAPNTRHVLLGAVYNSCACGVAEVSISNKMATIEHFYIADEYRKKGIGAAFMDFIIDTLEGNIHRIYSAYCDDDLYAHEFLGNCGFIRNKRADAFRVPFSIPEMVKQTPPIEPLELDKYRLCRQLHSTNMQVQNLLYSLGYKVPILNNNSCSYNNSFVIIDNNKVKGVMVNNFHEEDLYIDFITAKDPKSVFKLICLLSNSLNYDKIKPENIVFLGTSDMAVKLIRHLYPDTPLNKELSIYDAIFDY